MTSTAWPRGPRLLAAGAAFVVVLISLTACQYLPRTAVRLNSDGTLDIATCETLDDVSSVDFYVRRSDDPPTTVITDVLPARLDEGAVIHAGSVPPLDTWDRLDFSVVGEDEYEVWGLFDLSSLQPDEWTWANVERCDLNE